MRGGGGSGTAYTSGCCLAARLAAAATATGGGATRRTTRSVTAGKVTTTTTRSVIGLGGFELVEAICHVSENNEIARMQSSSINTLWTRNLEEFVGPRLWRYVVCTSFTI